MYSFKLEVFFDSVSVYESDSQDFVSCITELNDVIGLIYSFRESFGDHVCRTSMFTYSIKEVV